MQIRQHLARLAAVLLVVAFAAAPSFGLSMERASLKNLTEENGTILMGSVVETHSYWNEDGTWIITDVKLAPQDVIKGALKGGMLTVTMLGGTVGETTVLIPGSPRLETGKPYVLFVREGNLPGASGVQVMESFTQNVFDIVPDKNGFRAISQAWDAHLHPDAEGKTEAVGGSTGMSYEFFKNAIRAVMADSAEQ